MAANNTCVHGLTVRLWPCYLRLYMCLLIQLAQPIRLLLKYTGTEFEDVKYEQWEGSTAIE